MLVQDFRFRSLTEHDVQLSTQTHEVNRIARIVTLTMMAGLYSLRDRTVFHMREHFHEGFTFLQRLQHTVQQGVGSKWLQQVIGWCQLGSTDDFGIRALSGDHDENRRQRRQLVMAHIFQQLLTILSDAEVVFAQNQIKHFILDGTHGSSCRQRVFNFVDTTQIQHVMQAHAHALMRFYQQCADITEFTHYGLTLDSDCSDDKSSPLNGLYYDSL